MALSLCDMLLQEGDGLSLGDMTREEAELSLSQALARVEARWPFPIDQGAFLGFVAARIRPEQPLQQELLQLSARIEELALVFACLQNDALALECLAKEYLEQMTVRLRGIENEELLTKESRQRLWSRLLDATPPATPRLAQYAGAGSLKSWLQTAMTREALQMWRDTKKNAALDETFFSIAAPAQNEQELLFFRQVYAPAFKQAFQKAMETLSAKERNVLRYYYLDALSSEQIGRIYRVHRATVARWVANTQEQLLTQTYQEMQEQMGVSQETTQELFQLLQSQLDLSIIRMLQGA